VIYFVALAIAICPVHLRFRRLLGDMIVVGSNLLAISSACYEADQVIVEGEPGKKERTQGGENSKVSDKIFR
jgi:hypothetical protein